MSNPVLEFTLLDPEPETPSAGPISAEAYGRMLKELLPPGKVWRLDPDSILSLVLLASGDELSRVDGRGWDLIRESDPLRTDELLADFEQMLDLVAEGTEDERRARVAARLIRRQRFRPVDFQDALAPLLGQAAEDVVVMERTAAFAASVDDQREIYRFFIYRDPDAPGSYDLAAAQELVSDMKPSHTEGYVIESLDLLCDDEFSLCDRDLLGV